jgi:hypothetical protein
LLARAGEAFTPRPLPPQYSLGPLGRCSLNAAQAVLDDETLVYT